MKEAKATLTTWESNRARFSNQDRGIKVMHSAIEKLRSLAEENKTILCFGIDPNMEKIDGKGGGGTTEEEIVS